MVARLWADSLAGLTVDFTYDCLAIAPVTPGPYSVMAIINDPNYSGILTISPVLPVLTTTAASGMTAVAALSGGT